MKYSLCQPEHVSKKIISVGAIAVYAIHRLLVSGCSVSCMFFFLWRAMEAAHGHGLLTPDCMNQTL